MKNKIQAVVILISLSLMLLGIYLPGSQPDEGRMVLTNCQCHYDYDENVEPGFNWTGSMHKQATRDPIFLAAMDVANYDQTDAGEYCMRCHAPVGWINENAMPADGSALDDKKEDYDGVYCDVCHALVDPLSSEGQALITGSTLVTTYGMGMMVRTDLPQERGPRSDSDAQHPWMHDPFQASSDNCGICHDVSNPFNCPPGEDFNAQQCFPWGRTYSEWKQSWFATQGEPESCHGCHYPQATGQASDKDSPVREVYVHRTASANIWVREALIHMYPDVKDGDSASLRAAQIRALDTLQDGASVDLFDRTDIGAGRMDIKVTNLSGHKLPTGHFDSHRVWVNAIGYDASGSTVWQSGAYDGDSAILTLDSEIKVYEQILGVTGAGCDPTLSMMAADCIVKDNRIPPMGFTNAGFAAVRAEPVNYTYADGQYWDTSEYTLPLDVVSVDVNLYYQTLTKEFAEFFGTHAGSSVRGPALYGAWDSDTIGRSPPDLMFSTSIIIDGDTDGMGDAWETANSLNPADPSDAGLDLDGDGLTNLEEYQIGTLPGDSDTDNDGMDDGWEVTYISCMDPLTDDSSADPDSDGATNITEYGNSTDPCVFDAAPSDTDGDGLTDDDETNIYLTNPNDPDTDGDGVIDSAEISDGTDPIIASDFIRLVPRLIKYQARMFDSLNDPVNGQFSMTFSIHETADSSTVLWQEGSTVDVTQGIFHVLLGGDTIIGNDLFNMDDAFLKLKVIDEDLIPRRQLLSQSFAMNSLRQEDNRIETGTEVVNVASPASEVTVKVIFSRLFKAPPVVTVSSTDFSGDGGQLFIIQKITDVTNVGFTLVLESINGVSDSGNLSFTWLAHGE
jgi:H-type lectin domain-containing protein/thrombospondin type 3 repeat protein